MLLKKTTSQRYKQRILLKPEDFRGIEEKSPTAFWEFKGSLKEIKAEAERAYLRFLLERFAGNITECARYAGVSRRQLTNLLKRHNLEAGTYRRSRSK